MPAYLLRRVLSSILVVVAALVTTFLLFFAGPFDPAEASCGETKCTATRYAEIRASMHLDDPVLAQLGSYAKGIVVGRDYVSGGSVQHCPAPCLGYSYLNSQPVTEMIGHALPVSLSIIFGAAVIFLVVGVSTGILAAKRPGSGRDRALVTSSQMLGSTPYYVIALIAALYLTILNPILPRGEYHSLLSEGPIKWASGLLAAWLVLGLYTTASYVRYSRASMIESMSEDYVRTARAKGISERRVVYRHGLRAALVPVVTIFGIDVAIILTSMIFTEQIFGLPGIGYLTLRSFRTSDLPTIMGTVLVGSVALVVMNLLVDVLYSVLDPRVRLS